MQPPPAVGPSGSFASPVILANGAGGPLFLSMLTSILSWDTAVTPLEVPTASLSASAPEPLIILFARDKDVFALNITNSETRCSECTFVSEHPGFSSLP